MNCGLVLETPIESAIKVATNARLIEHVAPLWLPAHLPVVDFTYGRGKWWTRYFPPAGLTRHDLYTVDEGTDFHGLKLGEPGPRGLDYKNPAAVARLHPPGSVRVGVFDPPYISTGGDVTSTLPDFNDRFGLHTFDHRTPDVVMAGIVAGLVSIHATLPRYRLERWSNRKTGKVLLPAEGGWVLVKCMDYVSGGALVDAERQIVNAAVQIGYELLDRFVHITQPRAQPTTNLDGTPRRQQHSRRNYSTLIVLGRTTR